MYSNLYWVMFLTTVCHGTVIQYIMSQPYFFWLRYFFRGTSGLRSPSAVNLRGSVKYPPL